MTISIEQKWKGEQMEDGISRGDDSAEVYYICHADDNETRAEILDAARDDTNIPQNFEGLQIRSVALQQLDDHDYWDIVATYGSASFPQTLPKLDPEEIRITIQSGNGGTAKRKFSRGLVSETFATGYTAPALSGTAAANAVGIVYRDGDFEIDGVDVPIGGIAITLETTRTHAQMVTGGEALTITEYIDEHAVNSDTYQGYPAGTLMIESGSLKPQSGDEPDWDVVLNLLFSKNLTSIDVGNGITVPSKKGHQELDVLFVKKEIGSLPIPIPIRAAVHDMFPEISFTNDLLPAAP